MTDCDHDYPTREDHCLGCGKSTERADAAVARVCELLDDVSKKQAEIDRLQKRVDELEAWQKWAQELLG